MSVSWPNVQEPFCNPTTDQHHISAPETLWKEMM